MSLNWKEIALILSELPLTGSRIQNVYQLNIHTLVFELYHPEEHFWQLYVEIGTPEARIHRISGKRYVHRGIKEKKTQRFNQYLTRHISGTLITAVQQTPQDRIVTLTVEGNEGPLLLILRFYSTSRANVLVCDEHLTILDILYRRPAQGEMSGRTLVISPISSAQGDPDRFSVRQYPQEMSFNSYIEERYLTDRSDERSFLTEKIRTRMESTLSELHSDLEKTLTALDSVSSGEEYRRAADLLASNAHLIPPGSTRVTLKDWEGGSVEVELKRDLSVGDNISRYYQKYHKEKNRKDHLTGKLEILETQIEEHTARYHAFTETSQLPLKELRALAGQEQAGAQEVKFANAPGVYINNGRFDLLIGRNAKENELLLRSFARGNDFWMHTRDVPGGYVFIRSSRDKSVDLETIIDAGNLAIHYSKAKGQHKVDLYYTQVKYLKKVKGGKSGLVLPTQEKNYTIDYDEKRVEKLLSNQASEYQNRGM